MRSIVLIVLLFSLSLMSKAQKNHGKQNKPGFAKTHHKQSPDGKNYIVVKSTKRKGPPPWAPANGYRHRYIYFPAHHCYYDNYSGIYIYLKNKVWVTSLNIPVFINPIKARKVELVIDNVERPQIYFEQHLAIYR